ncbi:MAG: hypothetical protein DRJ38_02030 [Thermoprotei archaeon]|nr:MAG: hypothetical protein DRJ38_02030 [Thermoprotei archaeon]
MGRIKKGVLCSVKGCNNKAIRTISYSVFSAANTSLTLKEKSRRIYLCKEHYKIFKKKSKKQRTYEKWRIWQR